MLVVLIPFAVAGIAQFFAAYRKRNLRHVYSYIVILIAFAIIEFLPVQATDDKTAYYNTHAIILDSEGFTEEAV